MAELIRDGKYDKLGRRAAPPYWQSFRAHSLSVH